jgi:hypothetical protein
MNLKTSRAIPKLSVPPGYCPQSEDCNLEADLLDFYLLRQISSTDRVAMSASLMQGARKLSLHSLRHQLTDLSASQFARRVAEAWLQEDCPSNCIPTSPEMTWIQDSTQLATQLHHLLTEAQVPYYITGGVAAITYGEPRTTRDLDLVLSISSADLDRLVSTLEQEGFYATGVEDVKAGRMNVLQVTQIETISRADLMIAEPDRYEQLKFARRRLSPFPDGTEVYLACPEDVVISKLRWGERSQSEKQWRDVLGILKVQLGALDYEDMHTLAAEFEISEALERATVEAGVQAIASQQWANRLLPTVKAAYQTAQQSQRVSQTGENLEVAEGNFYVLEKDTARRTLTVNRKEEEQQVVQFDFEGNVLMAQPLLMDRQQWREITLRLRSLERQMEQSAQRRDDLEP